MKLLKTISDVLNLTSTFASSLIADSIEAGVIRVKTHITKILISVITLGIGVLLVGQGIGQIIDAYFNTSGVGPITAGILLVLTSAVLMK